MVIYDFDIDFEEELLPIDEWNDEYDKLIAKPIVSSDKSTMTVMEMGRMLGLKKTESYWLAHKSYFKLINVAGKLRVDIESFEEWYKRQIKYRKVDGPPPGEILKKESYSARDIAQMLQVSEYTVYDTLKKDNVPFIIVDCWKRWAKDDFDKWYSSQSRYRTEIDRKIDEVNIEQSIAMTEMAFLLGLHRNSVYDILQRPKYKDLFEIVIVAGQKRVTKESFLNWYNNQSKYSMLFDSIEAGLAKKYDKSDLDLPTENEIDKSDKDDSLMFESVITKSLAAKSMNPEYYSVDDISEILDCKRRTVLKLIREKKIQATPIAGSYRINKLEFDRWLIEKNEINLSEVMIYGIYN